MAILPGIGQQLVRLVHDVGAQIVTQAQILGHLIVTQEEERDIVLEVVFLRTAHIIIGNDLAPVSARNAHSRVTQTQVCGLDACAIVIESIFSIKLQPVGYVDISTIVTEGTPTLITILEAMTNIVWVGILHIWSEPVAMQLVLSCISVKILQTHVARNEKQLGYLSIETSHRTVLGFHARNRNLAICRKILIDSSTCIKVNYQLIQFLSFEKTLIVVETQRETEMTFLIRISESYGMELGETCIEVILQLIAIIAVSDVLTEKRRFHSAIKRSTECQLAGKRLVAILISLINRSTLRALSVLLLHRDCFSHLTPSKVTVVCDAEALLVTPLLGCNVDHTITCT